MTKQENIFTIVEQETISLTKATTKLKKMFGESDSININTMVLIKRHDKN